MLRAVLILLLLGSAGGARGADLGDLVDSVVATYGGAEARAGWEAFRVEARVAARMRGGTGEVRRDFAAPDRLLVRIAYPDRTELRVLDGERGWRGEPGRLQRVEGLPKLAMVYQLLRGAPPWALARYRERLEDRGSREAAGGPYRLVGLPWSPQLDLTYWVHGITRRVTRVEGVLRSPRGATAFATEYDDFRRTAGLLFPFREENYASGHHTGTTVVSAVTFSPPDLGPFDPDRLPR